MYSDFYFSSGGFNLLSIFFFLIFGIVVVIIVINIFKGISEWSSNNQQPVLDENGVHHSGSITTTYYVTFEFESKDRIELKVNGRDYGLLCENDQGKLKFHCSN